MSKDDVKDKELVAKVSDEIFKLILEGYTKGLIVKKLTKELGYTHNLTLYTYASVIKEIEDYAGQTTSELRSTYAEMYMSLYRDAKEQKDTKTAKVILDSIVKLNGLCSDKVEVSLVDAYHVKFD